MTLTGKVRPTVRASICARVNIIAIRCENTKLIGQNFRALLLEGGAGRIEFARTQWEEQRRPCGQSLVPWPHFMNSLPEPTRLKIEVDQ